MLVSCRNQNGENGVFGQFAQPHAITARKSGTGNAAEIGVLVNHIKSRLVTICLHARHGLNGHHGVNVVQHVAWANEHVHDTAIWEKIAVMVMISRSNNASMPNNVEPGDLGRIGQRVPLLVVDLKRPDDVTA